jgi:hypothetical protein
MKFYRPSKESLRQLAAEKNAIEPDARWQQLLTALDEDEDIHGDLRVFLKNHIPVPTGFDGLQFDYHTP